MNIDERFMFSHLNLQATVCIFSFLLIGMFKVVSITYYLNLVFIFESSIDITIFLLQKNEH